MDEEDLFFFLIMPLHVARFEGHYSHYSPEKITVKITFARHRAITLCVVCYASLTVIRLFDMYIFMVELIVRMLMRDLVDFEKNINAEKVLWDCVSRRKLADAALPVPIKLWIWNTAGEVEDVEGVEGSYDPYEHRKKQKYVGDFGSLANLIKSAAGTGLFAMPNAFACVGMSLGILGTVIMGLLITISLQLLMKTHYKMCTRVKSPMLTYDKLVSATLTKGPLKGHISPECATLIVDVMMLACYIGIGSVYVVFVSGIIQECIDMNKTLDQAYYAMMIFPVFLAMNLIKGLNNFAPISIIANAFIIGAAIIGIVCAVREGNGQWVYMEKDIKAYPKFIGVVFFSLCSPGLILAIQHSMKNPWNYTKACGVLNWGMAIITAMHVIIGAVVYTKWGSDAMGNFIRNHAEHNPATLTALAMQGVAIYFSYGLQCYMPISILYEDYAIEGLADGSCQGSPFCWNLIVRFGVTAVTCILAAAIPQLHLFISLVGALCISTLGTIMPAILFIVSYYGDFGRFKWRLIIAGIVFIVGLLAMLCGTVSSLLLIIHYLRYGDEN